MRKAFDRIYSRGDVCMHMQEQKDGTENISNKPKWALTHAHTLDEKKWMPAWKKKECLVV